MTTALLTHTECLIHVTPHGHAECVARLEAVMTALNAPEFADLHHEEAPLCDDAALLRVHPQSHLDHIAQTEPADGIIGLDPDTFLSAGSERAARRAVGALIRAVDMVMTGEARNAFAAIRPPGHHAEREISMGFCLYGSIAAAAKHALDVHGLSRVAVVDFDVHHGNGTQDLLWDEARTLFISLHQMPLYPGTGAAHETGAHNNVLNIPLPAQSDGTAMRQSITQKVIPALQAFEPELILISAGFDAHRDDPLAELNWTEDDYAWITEKLTDLAAIYCKGRIVSALEGGYNLSALAASVAAHVTQLKEAGK